MKNALQHRWQQLTLALQPPSQRGSRLVFDKKRQQAVLVVAGETWLWKNTAWSQAQGLRVPPARSTTHLVYDAARADVLLFGGIGVDGTPLNDVWLWNGVTWTEQKPANFPPALGAAAVACDAASQQVILFGGIAGFDGLNGSNRVGTLSSETWLWNGRTWTEQKTGHTPPARMGAQLVYDEASQQTLLFGGHNFTGYLNDVWLWNGTDWNELSPAASPPAQARYNAIFHEQLQQIMLVGEIMGGENQLQRSYQTWLWNGATWSQTATTAAPAGSIESIAYNGATSAVIAHVVSGEKAYPGGKSAAAALPDVVSPALGSETWLWG